MDTSSFKTDEPNLQDLLNRIHEGDLQLPDFQRGWVWNDSHICSLIASVSKSYPIGSVMLMETGGQEVRFKPRTVEGAPENGTEPKSLILDGQQRMTSLYLALRSGKPVQTRNDQGKDIERVYYLNIEKCLDSKADREEEAVLSLPADRVRRTNFNRDIDLDLSSREQEYKLGYFPLASMFSNATLEWLNGYQEFHKSDPEKVSQFFKFHGEILNRFEKYRVPVIDLNKNTNKEAICQIFEKVNTGGVDLDVFELMTATFAADGFDLRKDWEKWKEKLRGHKNLKSVEKTDFLQAITLLTSYESHRDGVGISCKRRDILNLTLEQYRENAIRIAEGFQGAARFLVREKVFAAKNLPYRTQLVPLSSICAVLDKKFESDVAKRKISHWYWSGVFGELYGGSTETRFAYDIVDVVNWIDSDDAKPRTLRDANLAPTRLLTLKTRQSAAYKGIMALLMRVGSKDFMNGDGFDVTTYFDERVDIHHVFPKRYCEKRKYPDEKWNSIINKTPIRARTNRILGGKAPSAYLADIDERDVSSSNLDGYLESHLINPQLLRNDDFDGFIQDRASQLLNEIEKVMGKPVAGRDSDEVVSKFGSAI